MRRKISTEDTWRRCLDMWQFVAEIKLGNIELKSTIEIKEYWLKINHFRNLPAHECFFCEGAYDKELQDITCELCPATFVQNSTFNCTNKSWHWYDKPVEFFNKINELNERRLRQKK